MDNLGFTMAMTLAVMTIEDVPQLVLNCIYLDTAGFGEGGGSIRKPNSSS